MERPRTLDLVIAVAFLVWAVIEVIVGVDHGPVAVNLVAAIVSPAALAWRRIAPSVAALVCAGGLVFKTLAGLPLDGLALLAAVLVAAYSAGRRVALRRAVVVAAVMIAFAWLSLLGLPRQDQTVANYPFVALWIGAPAAAGAALRHEIAKASRAADRAARAEVVREQYAQAAVLDERLRLARELHDTVAHAVSVMVLNAGAVRSRLPGELGSERAALERTESQGRQAISQLRRMLGVLRATSPAAELDALPTLEQVPELVDDTRQLGIAVDLVVDGPVTRLEPGLQLCAYRVVQEALTNVRKHSGASAVTVRVAYDEAGLRIRVADDGAGPGHAGAGEGHGLIGLRERVELYGGTFAAAAAAEGFVVTADLPVVAG